MRPAGVFKTFSSFLSLPGVPTHEYLCPFDYITYFLLPAAYGRPSGGLNAGVAELTNRSLFEIYLKPWRAMAAVGLRSLMVAHQPVNDIPCHANGWLINGVMRSTYGFGAGFTISDEMDNGVLGPWGWA